MEGKNINGWKKIQLGALDSGNRPPKSTFYVI